MTTMDRLTQLRLGLAVVAALLFLAYSLFLLLVVSITARWFWGTL